MYLQFNKSKGKNGKVYHSVLLCKKFRDKETGKPKTEVILNLSKFGLDNKTITALKTAINKTKGVLVDSEDIKIHEFPSRCNSMFVLVGDNKGVLIDTPNETTGTKSLVEWIKSVEIIKDKFKEAKIVIPGHGDWGDTQLFSRTIDVLNKWNTENISR